MKISRRTLTEIHTELIFLNELYNNILQDADKEELQENIRYIKFTLRVLYRLINDLETLLY